MFDAQWTLIEPLLPPVHWDDRKKEHPRRAIMDAILHLNQTGRPWRYLPVGFPPWQTVYWHLRRWERQGAAQHITGTLGLPLQVMVCPASVQDRAGTTTLLPRLYLFPRRRTVFANQGFAGRLVGRAAATLGIALHITGKPPGRRGFQVHPRRWVAERTLGRLMVHRRLARDHERRPATSEALIRWAATDRRTVVSPTATPPRDPDPRTRTVTTRIICQTRSEWHPAVFRGCRPSF
ncbi:transposase [Actinomadura hibisca]|uniref:transposase n=1 Tax=Actinomadura hibisca TaxID=68565 RepID=UPI001C3F1860|nr:transposase [Actinomadura hibisca]